MSKIKKSKLLAYALAISGASLLPGAVVSCACTNSNKKNSNDFKEVIISKHSFKNYNPEYTIREKSNLSAYKIKDDKSKTVYIEIDEFLNALDGLINLDSFSVEVNEKEKTKTYSSKTETGEILNTLTINWEKNTIHTTNTSFFYEILKPQELTDGDQFLEVNYESRNLDNEGVTFDLGKYDMDIAFNNKKVLVPFAVFNTLFLSQTFNNTYFNGLTFTNLEAGFDSWGVLEDEERERIRGNEEKRNGEITVEERQANFNHLAFTMDNFYGLKHYKQMQSFESYISKEDKEKLLSTNPDDFNEAYVNIFHKQLNELHTNLNSFSYHEQEWHRTIGERLVAPRDYGQYRIDFEKNERKLISAFEKKFNKKVSQFGPDDFIRYHGNTAFVTLLEFQDGTKEEIESDEAWQYDTYFLMRHLMSELKKKPEIKHVVLDLAINGGGSVYSMIRTLGFMTDKEILNREFDILNRRADLSKSKVDTDGDGNYDNDAYTQYNWNLLVGLNTFSAANQLASIVKEMGIAKIIGKKTGGGMSAIMPISLMDGTTITISSPNNAVHGEDNREIESGITPDIELEYEDFYNDEKINEILDKAYPAATE
ncbi:S41 family peptidase [Metamycoplasma gateae]|uniref:S41 family peptidase n=1 Tax=Metamycoplasma gateae TaxID=35769 RepID=A0ABZ2AML1_9BACT|nr:S41 family peptidase [Metamycoplasma gateae]